MSDTPDTTKRGNGNAGLGFILLATVTFLLFQVHIVSMNMATSLLVPPAIVACVAIGCLTHYRVTRLQLEDARSQRLLEENRQTEIRQQQLELARMDFELEMAKLNVEQRPTRALPPAQKRARVVRFR